MGLLARPYRARNPFDDRWYTSGPVVAMDGSWSPDAALKVATVYRAVNVAAAAVAVLPVDVLKRQGKGWVPAEGDSFRTKLRLQPNVLQTSFRWRHHLVGHLMLGGNYYAHKYAWDFFDQTLRQLRPLSPARMRAVEVAGDGTLRYEYTLPNGLPQPLTQDQVFHARGFSVDGINGVSVLTLMREHVEQASMSRQQRTSMLRNGMRPSVVITFPEGKELGAGAETNVIQGYMKAYGGPSKVGRPMVLGDGADIKPFALTGKDAQWVESDQFLIEEFLRFTGIPGVLVGYADKTATYASAEAFFQSFVTHCIWPITSNLEQELTVSLWGVQEDIKVRFNLNALLRADSAARAAFYRALVELGIFTRNEIREIEDRNPLKGLDEPLTPKNMGGSTPEGAAPAGAAPAAAPRPAPAPTGGAPGFRRLEEDASAGRARRAMQIALRAAARLHRKELHALQGFARRYAADPAGWREKVEAFYEEHAELVAEALDLGSEGARAYCRAACDEVLAGGMTAVEAWDAEACAATLAEMALGAPPPPTVVVENRVAAPAVLNRVEVPAQPAPVVQNNIQAPAAPAVQDVRIIEMPLPPDEEIVVGPGGRDGEGRLRRAFKRPVK